jgi:hypothetical protein
MESGKICILCKSDIKDDPYGHNPEPLASIKDGVCCSECNSSKVIPARLNDIQKNLTDCAICGKITQGRKIRGFWNNRLREVCGDGTSELQTSSQETESSQDCLANNPRCPCELLLNVEMFVWRDE